MEMVCWARVIVSVVSWLMLLAVWENSMYEYDPLRKGCGIKLCLWKGNWAC